MKKNKDRAYTPSEISKILKIKSGTILATMSKLSRKGILLSKTPYYIYNNPKVKK